MFTVWGDGGIQTPYVLGDIRRRKVEKIAPSSTLQKTTPHSQDADSQAPSFPSPARTDIYQTTDHQTLGRGQAILAKQIMTSPVHTLSPTSELSDAWEIIQRKRFRHIPVVTPQDQLVGILSDRDVFRATIEIVTAPERSRVKGYRQFIQEIMVKHVLSAAPETEIRTIARIFFEERIGAMPIVAAHGILVGILTRSDILRVMVNEAPFELWI